MSLVVYGFLRANVKLTCRLSKSLKTVFLGVLSVSAVITADLFLLCLPEPVFQFVDFPVQAFGKMAAKLGEVSPD